VWIALDDFGSGFSSLACICQLPLEVVVEGLETGENVAFLKEVCCDRGQGYYCNRAVPADDLVDYPEKRGIEGKRG